MLIVEWCDAFDALMHGKLVLEKVKNAISLSSPDLPRSKPNKDLKISMSNAKFAWEIHGESNGFQLDIEDLIIPTVCSI